MRSFFSKIFASFLLTMVGATCLCGVVFFLLQKANVEDVRQAEETKMLYRTAQMVLYSGQAAFGVYQSQGLEAYKDFIRELEERTGAKILIFTGTKGVSIDGKELPKEDRELYQKAYLFEEYEVMQYGPTFHTAKFFEDYVGGIYIIVAKYTLPPPPGHFRKRGDAEKSLPPWVEEASRIEAQEIFDITRSIQEFWWAWLCALGILGGCSCYLVARSLSSSIRNLRQVTHKLADGNFTARTGLELSDYTGDEVKDLAYDFDKMAARLEKQAERQRTLLRDISHELRSPLARIQVAIELVRKGRANNLTKIEENAKRLDNLIGELLASSRDEHGKDTLGEDIDLEELLGEIVEDGVFEGQEHNKLVVMTTTLSLIVRGNSEILRRGLENVVRNALRFTPPQTSVKVSLEKHEGMACIIVKDEGPGVPEAELEDIFLPFYRVDNNGYDVQKNGVGLAIVKESIDFHEGRVFAQNIDGVLGHGLEVRMYLPLLQE